MNKVIYKAVALLFATNLAMGLAACSGGGCGKQEEEENNQPPEIKQEKAPLNTNVNRGGVPSSAPQTKALKTSVETNSAPQAPEAKSEEAKPDIQLDTTKTSE